MSIDEHDEQKVYEAMRRIALIPRPKERERICKNVMEMCRQINSWQIIFKEQE